MRTGLDARTWTVLTGWDHCVQSIGIILTTRIGSRVMRREFGSRLKELQDRNASPAVIAAVYAAIAGALARWEPGFRLRTMLLDRAGPDGVFVFILEGDYCPFGHLGDYRTRETKAAVIGITGGLTLGYARSGA